VQAAPLPYLLTQALSEHQELAQQWLLYEQDVLHPEEVQRYPWSLGQQLVLVAVWQAPDPVQ